LDTVIAIDYDRIQHPCQRPPRPCFPCRAVGVKTVCIGLSINYQLTAVLPSTLEALISDQCIHVFICHIPNKVPPIVTQGKSFSCAGSRCSVKRELRRSPWPMEPLRVGGSAGGGRPPAAPNRRPSPGDGRFRAAARELRLETRRARVKRGPPTTALGGRTEHGRGWQEGDRPESDRQPTTCASAATATTGASRRSHHTPAACPYRLPLGNTSWEDHGDDTALRLCLPRSYCLTSDTAICVQKAVLGAREARQPPRCLRRYVRRGLPAS
jgi:hypothetical protein